MTQYFLYLIEVSICLALFYLIYLMLIKDDTFYKLKRFYLLGSVAIALLIPNLPSTSWTKDIKKTIVSQKFEDSPNSIFQDTFENIVYGSIPQQARLKTEEKNTITFLEVIFILYILGVGFMLFRLVNNLYQILILVKRNVHIPYGKYTIISLDDDYPTFSFFRYIFLNGRNLNDNDKNDVLFHEETHIKQGHSFDIIFIELCKILFWFNPIIWLYKKSLLKVHECLADEYLVQSKSKSIQDYQSLLLKQYLSKINIELAHPFNYSLIKFRINMMTKTKSKWWAKYKLVFAIPVVILSLVAFTNEHLNVPNGEISKKNNSQVVTQEQTVPNGMVFIPAGSFVLKRSVGTKTKDFNVTIDAFWMRQTEVSVKEYFEYVDNIKKDSTRNVYEKALPNKENAPFENYFTDAKYSNYPVVGITLIQAQNYCKWKTSIENKKLKDQGKPQVQNYRIPTEAEWIYASFGGIENPENIIKPQISKLSEIGSKNCNEFGLYNIFDNVSEWTSSSYESEKYLNEVQTYPKTSTDRIIVKGNNFKNTAINDKLILIGNNSYDFVGFRYVRSYLQ